MRVKNPLLQELFEPNSETPQRQVRSDYKFQTIFIGNVDGLTRKHFTLPKEGER